MIGGRVGAFLFPLREQKGPYPYPLQFDHSTQLNWLGVSGLTRLAWRSLAGLNCDSLAGLLSLAPHTPGPAV